MIATSARHSSAKSKSEADEQVLHSLKTCWRRKQGYSTIGNALGKFGTARSPPQSHIPTKNENWQILFNFSQIEKNSSQKKTKIYKCCAVLKMSLCRVATRSCIWRLGNTLTHWPHVSKLSVSVAASWSIPEHRGGTNIPCTPRRHEKLPLLWISASSVLFR